jgi:NAD(P)-dependent dehydrogenase (short-subunit alcohol dehydrogenase family)
MLVTPGPQQCHGVVAEGRPGEADVQWLWSGRGFGERVVELVEDLVGTFVQAAAVSAAGHVPFKLVTELTAADYRAAFHGKVLSQIELVRQGLAVVAERGSFTLITGVLAREPIPTGTAASMANGAVESFVRAAAIEIAPQRINAISPNVFTESLPDYADFFPGMGSVDLADVARVYVRSVEGAQTGQIYTL